MLTWNFKTYLKKIGKMGEEECECKLEADSATHGVELYCPKSIKGRDGLEKLIGPITSLEMIGRNLGKREVAEIIKTFTKD
jgi:hypothetical protein